MTYVNKATITLSVQKHVPIEGMKEKKHGMPTINLLWYLNGMLVIVDKLHLE